MWQKSKAQIDTKLKNSNCDNTIKNQMGTKKNGDKLKKKLKHSKPQIET